MRWGRGCEGSRCRDTSGVQLGHSQVRCIQHLLWADLCYRCWDVSGAQDTGLGEDVLASGRVHVQMLTPRRLDASPRQGTDTRRGPRPSTGGFSDEFKAQASTRAPVSLCTALTLSGASQLPGDTLLCELPANAFPESNSEGFLLVFCLLVSFVLFCFFA